jgi:hypothetical protein
MTRQISVTFDKEGKSYEFRETNTTEGTNIIYLGISSNALIATEYRPPVRVEGRELIIEPELMLPEVYYPVKYEGVNQLVKKRKDGKIEFYEVIGDNDGDAI